YSSFWSAAELAKVRPEIYAMGMRNPFRFTVDSKTGWVIWGDVGPDANEDVANRGFMGHDELNVATKPGFYGWPYCNGNQYAYNDVDYSGAAGVPGAKFDCAAPVNNSPNNTGVNKLPPSQGPIVWYAKGNKADFQDMLEGGETAMSGPMYRYNKNLASATKFPPQYDGRIYFWDWSRKVHKLVSLKPDGKLDKMIPFPDATMRANVSAQYGPEGSLYILQYSELGYGDFNSALFRFDYTGSRDEACIPVSVAGSSRRSAAGPGFQIMAGFSAIEIPEGFGGLEAYDIQGKRIWSFVRAGTQGRLRVNLPAHIAGGLFRVRFL
nr:PQQ-dependent sugar dehydrogenase [Fibrobacterota bacterium]